VRFPLPLANDNRCRLMHWELNQCFIKAFSFAPTSRIKFQTSRMQAYRSLEESGATAVGKPSVFLDQNLSHPNLEWRVLRSQHLIRQTTESKELLDMFEEARSRGANPQPLYKKGS
jgi:hypothetical protein